jgi:hypothetical protein
MVMVRGMIHTGTDRSVETGADTTGTALSFLWIDMGQKSLFGLAPNAARAWDAESLLDLCRLI